MSGGRFLILGVAALLLAGCASPRPNREAKSQNDKVSLVIMPVIVVSPNRDTHDSDSSPSRDDDSHPRTLLLRNLQYHRPLEFEQVPES
jgi:hypothetical protein